MSVGMNTTDMPAVTPTATDLIPVAVGGVPKSVTPASLAQYTIDAIEAVTAGTAVTGADSLFVLQSGVMKPVDIDLVAQHAIDTVWAKAAEAAPEGTDTIPLKSAAEQTMTLAVLAEYVRATIEAAVLDVSNLTAASSLAAEDVLLVTVGTTGKKVAVSVLNAAIYAALSAHVTALAAVSAPADTDVFYSIQGGVAKKVTLATLKTAFGSVIAPATSTENKVPQWSSGALTLKDGLTLRTAVRASGTADDTSLPTEKAVRDLAGGFINAQTDIGAAVEGTDTFLVDDGAAGTQRKSAVSRLWDYVVTRVQGLTAKTAPVAADILTIQDSADSDALKELTLANLKTHLDTVGTYDHLFVPASGMTPSVTAGCAALAAVEYAANDMTHSVLAFDGAAANESAEFNIVMPPAWDRGTIKFKAYWAPGHADANPDEYISLSLAAGAFSDGDGLDSALGTPQIVADQVVADDDLHLTAASPALTVAGSPALGDLIHFKLTRDFDYAGAGAAMDVDLRLIGVVIQYQKTNVVAAW